MLGNKNFRFASVLASTVHDFKNSLGALQEIINRVSQQYQQYDNPDFIQLEFEAKRMNHSMMQLLVLYKIDIDKFNLQIDEHPVVEILEEVRAQHLPLLQRKQILLDIECSEDLLIYCDATQISNALGTILNNSQRYSQSCVKLSAYIENGFTCFCIEDDGDGYPKELLNINNVSQEEIDWIAGNTGLGLYFVSIIAALHVNDSSKGYTVIDNTSRLGGARFRLFLP